MVAVKQAHDDLDEARRIVAETGLALYSGDDPITFTFLELGGIGVVSVHAHVTGVQIKEMIRRYRAGTSTARERRTPSSSLRTTS